MIAAREPLNEVERLQELYKYELLDTVYESEFDAIVQLASKICKTPISVITLLDSKRQWFKAKVGLDNRETDRGISFCAHAILNDGMMEVQDAVEDNRFFDNPLVTGEPNIRYYAGVPLVTRAGYKLGTLCVIDRVPRHLDSEQAFAMQVLSAQVVKLFELRILNKELKSVTDVQQKIIAIMAHDIRGPLASIQTSYELKSDGRLTADEIKEIDGYIPIQLASTIGLLDNIVDWSRAQLSLSADQHRFFNLHELCEGSFKLLTIAAKTKNNKLLNGIDKGLEINGNPEIIEFILRNLLGNANKFTNNGTITVNAGLSNDQLHFSVTDTGTGIDPKKMSDLQKGNLVTTARGTNNEKGSGVGLKLIFEYIAAHKGSINFRNNEPNGTIVSVELPIT